MSTDHGALNLMKNVKNPEGQLTRWLEILGLSIDIYFMNISYNAFIPKPSFCQNISNFNCGLSDYHNIISFQLKGFVPKIKKEFINYRSFKSFDQEKFVHELNCVNFDNLLSVDDVNEAYSNFQSEFVNIIDKHIYTNEKKKINSSTCTLYE